MTKISRDEIKKHGFKRFLASWKYSMEGLIYAYKYEQSMLIHVIATICVIIANIVLSISPTEWLITFLAIGMVLAAELINTAIEAIVDLVTLEIHPLAKISKDVSSGAVLVSVFGAIIVGLIIYLPKIIDILCK